MRYFENIEDATAARRRALAIVGEAYGATVIVALSSGPGRGRVEADAEALRRWHPERHSLPKSAHATEWMDDLGRQRAISVCTERFQAVLRDACEHNVLDDGAASRLAALWDAEAAAGEGMTFH